MSGPVIAGAPGPGALTLGRWTAETLGVPLIVAVVHPAPAALGSGRVDAEWVADRHRAAQQVLDEARESLPETGSIEYRLVASSSAAHGLHDLAEQTGAALVVIGSGQEALGSTAERLLSGNACPVAVVPGDLVEQPGTLGLIGVAYVDTPDGRAALQEAARLAAGAGARLRLYTVVAEGRSPLPFLHDAERVFHETARETYEHSLATAARSVPEVEADWRIISGDVVDTLAGLDEVDVLFCGSRGYGPARRVLLGGVSTRLLRRARRPVVVVPRSG
ncbi:nucleotide-binding universal stress UspA family protein [Actinoplanes tereljensis]|uniref:Universal stress protein n=1 Tax=Paractinoplanes tereljensis TaxID=571912 RepID=A0A919NXE4_9ACTN|nr:universal stress protein [Actinoplanes tereljensis]GIF25995.1 universal stress protein [Actinoplanes tereljensis]